MRVLLAPVLFLLAMAAPASAQIVFTLNATPVADDEGYSSEQTYTLVFTSASSFNSPSGYFTPTTNYWLEDAAIDPTVWTAVGGTGLLGNYVRPTANFDDPYSYVSTENNSGNSLSLVVENEGNYSIGLATLAGTPLRRIDLVVSQGDMPNFDYPEIFVEPFDAATGYFSSYFGTYTGFSDGFVYIYQANGGGGLVMQFTINSLTISSGAAAVPEPSTYAVLAGVAALGLAVIRRRVAA